MGLSSFSNDTPTEHLVAALRQDGAVIAENWISHTLADQIASELRPHFDEIGHEQCNDFNGHKTLRLNSVLNRSSSSADLVEHDQLLSVLDAILLPFCQTYRLGSLTAVEILPGESAQDLHRDDHIYPLRQPGLELQVGVMWAFDDFTLENGATCIIPGSHQWFEMHPKTRDDKVEQAAMPRGSALIYLGSMMHGGGANRSNMPRMGLINTYALGWLRQEENLYTKIPQETVQTFSARVQELIGYKRHGEKLGWFRPLC